MGGINKEPTINTQLAYERNNNSSMVQDVMGADDDEYGEYGEEANFKKEGEADYDFMWMTRIIIASLNQVMRNPKNIICKLKW